MRNSSCLIGMPTLAGEKEGNMYKSALQTLGVFPKARIKWCSWWRTICSLLLRCGQCGRALFSGAGSGSGWNMSHWCRGHKAAVRIPHTLHSAPCHWNPHPAFSLQMVPVSQQSPECPPAGSLDDARGRGGPPAVILEGDIPPLPLESLCLWLLP